VDAITAALNECLLTVEEQLIPTEERSSAWEDPWCTWPDSLFDDDQSDHISDDDSSDSGHEQQHDGACSMQID
jgi:hypothetical protein